MEQLDKLMLYGVYPIMLLCAVYFTLMGFKIVPTGIPDKSEEAALEKRLTLLRWFGPILIIGILGYYILKFTGVF